MKKILLLSFISFILSACAGDKLIVVGHRGAALLAPENSLAAMEAGIEAGADMVEIDIHLCADGKVVVCHDDRVDRTTSGQGYISELSWDQLSALSIKDASGNLTTERIPTLEQIFDLVGRRAQVLIEIKRYESSLSGIEQACIDIIRRYKAEKRVVIQSFDPEVLVACHEIAPDLRYERLIAQPWEGFDPNELPFAASINMHYSAATPEFLAEVRAAGKEVKVWTLDEYLPELIAAVDGVITDNPGIFL